MQLSDPIRIQTWNIDWVYGTVRISKRHIHGKPFYKRFLPSLIPCKLCDFVYLLPPLFPQLWKQLCLNMLRYLDYNCVHQPDNIVESDEVMAPKIEHIKNNIIINDQTDEVHGILNNAKCRLMNIFAITLSFEMCGQELFLGLFCFLFCHRKESNRKKSIGNRN